MQKGDFDRFCWFIFLSLSSQSKKALKSILQKCTYLPALEPLLYDAPSNILKHVVCQFSKVSQPESKKSVFLIKKCQNIWWIEIMKPCSFTLTSLLSKVLPHDSKARRLFVTSGGLKKVQEMDAEQGSPLQEYINAINSCFPEEIVRYAQEPLSVCVWNRERDVNSNLGLTHQITHSLFRAAVWLCCVNMILSSTICLTFYFVENL